MMQLAAAQPCSHRPLSEAGDGSVEESAQEQYDSLVHQLLGSSPLNLLSSSSPQQSAIVRLAAVLEDALLRLETANQSRT